MSRPSPNRTDATHRFHAFEVSCFSAKVLSREASTSIDETARDPGAPDDEYIY